MTNEQILQKAIEKAGLKWYDHYGEIRVNLDNGKTLEGINDIIFSHDFAKAFWGEEYIHISVGNWDEVRNMTTKSILAWQYHLQQMVLLEEPLKYIKKFL